MDELKNALHYIDLEKIMKKVLLSVFAITLAFPCFSSESYKGVTSEGEDCEITVENLNNQKMRLTIPHFLESSQNINGEENIWSPSRALTTVTRKQDGILKFKSKQKINKYRTHEWGRKMEDSIEIALDHGKPLYYKVFTKATLKTTIWSWGQGREEDSHSLIDYVKFGRDFVKEITGIPTVFHRHEIISRCEL